MIINSDSVFLVCLCRQTKDKKILLFLRINVINITQLCIKKENCCLYYRLIVEQNKTATILLIFNVPYKCIFLTINSIKF